MRRQLSLLMLVSRSQIYRVLAILAAMAVVQLGVARWSIAMLDESTGYAVETVLDGVSRWVPAVAMLAIFASFGALGRRGGRVDYTWYRLPVPNWSRNVWPLVGGVLVFLLVWAVQVAVAVGIVVLYSRIMPERIHQQTLFLATYRSAYFHSLLPLADGIRWAIAAFRYVGLGLYAGVAMIRSLRSKRTILPMVAVIAMTLVISPMGSYEWELIVLGILWFMICMTVLQLPDEVEEEAGEEETP